VRVFDLGYALFIFMLCVLQENVSALLREWEPLILQWPVLGSAARQDLLARLASSELIFFMALKDSSTFEKVWRGPWGFSLRWRRRRAVGVVAGMLGAPATCQTCILQAEAACSSKHATCWLKPSLLAAQRASN